MSIVHTIPDVDQTIDSYLCFMLYDERLAAACRQVEASSQLLSAADLDHVAWKWSTSYRSEGNYNDYDFMHLSRDLASLFPIIDAPTPLPFTD